MTSLVAINP